VKQLLNSALQFKKAFDQISPVLDKILNADWFTAMAGSVKGVKALKDLYNALANVNTEGLECYIRISNAIMDNTGGFELYSTEDGVHYTQLIDHGFHDRFNYGCRSFIVGSDGLYIGTANPFYGAQLWKMNEITADLATLSADGIELNFDPAVTDYQASVASDVDAIHLTAVGADAGTQVLVNGISAADGAIPVALQAGKNVIRIETASIDGSKTAVYTLTVTRGALPAGSTQLDPTEPDTQEPTKPEVPGTTIPGIGQTVKPQDMQSPSVSGETEAPEQTETRPASNVENVEIPDTGSHTSASMLAVLALGAAAAVALSRKKRR
uniref:cadherin-like beta sandwich domain-containing protein n=1 Tax=Candidatus Fimivicinus sp. TaxID=3056640 RepID=UPI003FEFCE9B